MQNKKTSITVIIPWLLFIFNSCGVVLPTDGESNDKDNSTQEDVNNRNTGEGLADGFKIIEMPEEFDTGRFIAVEKVNNERFFVGANILSGQVNDSYYVGMHWMVILVDNAGNPVESFNQGKPVVLSPDSPHELGRKSGTITSVAFHEDKLYTAGTAWNDDESSYEGVVYRLNMNGSMDSDFGVNGQVKLKEGSFVDINDIAIDETSGKIMLAGQLHNLNPARPLIYQLNNDGSLNEGFGIGGALYGIESSPVGGNFSKANAIISLGNGEFLLSGRSQGPFIAKLNIDGNVEFLTQKEGTTLSYWSEMVLLADDSVLAIGLNDSRQTILGKFTNEGQSFETFGSEGTMILGTPQADSSSLNVDSQNRIVATYGQFNSEPFLIRLLPDNELDEEFNQKNDTSKSKFRIIDSVILSNDQIIGVGSKFDDDAQKALPAIFFPKN